MNDRADAIAAQLAEIRDTAAPLAPAATDGEILERLLDGFTNLDALHAATERLGGRWVLLAHDGAR
jgi:hypothetical protein